MRMLEFDLLSESVRLPTRDLTASKKRNFCHQIGKVNTIKGRKGISEKYIPILKEKYKNKALFGQESVRS